MKILLGRFGLGEKMNKKQIILTIAVLFSFSGIASADYVIQFSNSQSKGIIPEQSVPETFSSCKDILDNSQSTGDGVYTINVNSKEFNVYCDMTSAGGGWTMVVAQFEQDPVTNWNEGIQADYDPLLSTNKGFALNTQEIPNHTQTAFGKDFDSNFIDFFNFEYITGDIPKTLITGLKSNDSYHINRDVAYSYFYCDPEENVSSSPTWFNALTIDKTGGINNDWCIFSLRPDTVRYQVGYAMNGSLLSSSNESYAWTVWVR